MINCFLDSPPLCDINGAGVMMGEDSGFGDHKPAARVLLK